jgi:hypothetical protein
MIIKIFPSSDSILSTTTTTTKEEEEEERGEIMPESDLFIYMFLSEVLNMKLGPTD